MFHFSLPSLILLVALSACQSKSSGSASGSTSAPSVSPNAADDSIPNTVLAGVMEGAPWNLSQGRAEIIDGQLQMEMSDEATTVPCSPLLNSHRLLSIVSPAALGESRLPGEASGLKASLTLRKEGQVVVHMAERARLVISEITATEVKGALALEVDTDHRVRGIFQVPLCPGVSVPSPVPSPAPTPGSTPVPAPGPEERSLGRFALQTARGAGASNDMNIGRPAAKKVFADFSFEAKTDTRLSFYRGTSSGANCEVGRIKRSVTVMKLDESGNVTESKGYESYPTGLTVGAGKYLVRHSVEGFGDFCDYLRIGFIATAE